MLAMGKLRSLEMLRALAALLVVLFHTEAILALRFGSSPFGGVFSAGHRGVDLFFVLSGFIIAHVHAKDLGTPSRLANYFFNRLSRIYPAVWIMTALALPVYLAGFGGTSKADKLDTSAILSSILLLPQRGVPLVSVTWTLTYEMFFYVLFGIAILSWRTGLIGIAVWQLLIIAFVLTGERLGLVGYYLNPICLDFSIGLMVAFYVQRFPQSLRPLLAAVLLLLGIGAFILGMTVDTVPFVAGALCSIGSGLMIIALISLERRTKLQIPEVLVALGGASYAIYLTHFSVITIISTVLHRFGIKTSFKIGVLCAAIGVLAGYVFDRLIDSPIRLRLLSLKRRLFISAAATPP